MIRKRDRKTAGALLGGLVLPVIFSAGVWAAVCPPKLTPAEVSLEVRKLQTTLMVAALSCGHRDNYNNFVTSFKPELQKFGNLMRSHFRKRYGAGAKKKLNSYVTALANEASERSNVDYDAFCSNAAKLYDSLKGRKPSELGPIASKAKQVEFALHYKGPNSQCGQPQKNLFPDIRKVDPLSQ
jgi:hypothetical protein